MSRPRALAIARPTRDPLVAVKTELREKVIADRRAREAATRARAELAHTVHRARKARLSWRQIAETAGLGVMTVHDIATKGTR